MSTQEATTSIAIETVYVPQDVNPPPAYTPFPNILLTPEQKLEKPLPPLPQEYLDDNHEFRPRVPPKDKEDVLAILRQYDTAIILDDSVSMRDENRWTQAKNVFFQLGQIAARYDMDGIDLHFLNNDHADGKNLKSIEFVEDRFRAAGYLSGGSFLGLKLDELLREYWLALQDAQAEAYRNGGKLLNYIKPINLIVITDGHTDDDLKEVIVRWASLLDGGVYPMHQVGIQIVQVGTDQSASEELQELDQYVRKHCPYRDMLDITRYEEQEDHLTAKLIMNKILTGSINPRMQMTLVNESDHHEDTTPSPSE